MGKNRIRIKLGDNELEVEGSEDFVKEEVNNLLKKIKKINYKVNSDKKKAVQETPDEKQNDFDDEAPYIKDFTEEKNPTSQMEAAAVLAYYLREYENIEEFEKEDLEELWLASEFKPPKNISQTLRNVKNRKGWFDRVSSGIYKFTTHGIHYVKKELPKGE